jgi:hypothetical protein
LRAEDYSEQKLEIDGWPIHLVTYRVGAVWHCHADNVSPGSTIARANSDSKEEVERSAIERAREMLARTRRQTV